MKLGVLGVGNMGSAVIKGVKAAATGIEIFAYDKDGEKLSAASVTACKSENELVKTCKYVLLAVKPQVLGEVLDTIKESVTPETVFISFCAGISQDYIRSHK